MNGQCCKHCINRIQRAFQKNMPIKYIYWSNTDGQIQKNTLSEAVTKCTHISKGDTSKNNYKIC